MIDKKINSPLSSSAGRLFDAVSALLNICPIAEFHAEAPMRLEDAIENNIEEAYSYEISNSISFKTTIREIVDDLKNNIEVSIISAKFHNTIVNLIVEESIKLREKYNINKVVMSGGSFQNIYLSEKAINKLSENKFTVFSHSNFPANDGGLSLGQIAIAAKRRELKLL
jgi:hydrogenase maturation protein HypF